MRMGSPYTSIFPIFASLRSYVKEECPPELQNKAGHKIRQWYRASVFTTRYSGSIEGCAHGGVPSIKAHGFLSVSARFPELFGESIRREKRLQPLQVFLGPRKRLAFFFRVVHTPLVSLGAASALQASEA